MISLQAERVAILRAIRDEQPSLGELADRFGLSTEGSWSAPRVTRSEPMIRGAVGASTARLTVWEVLLPLKAARLIEVDENEVEPCLARVRHTPLLEALQTSLGLSLTALLETHNPSLLRVAPFHGVPDDRQGAADVFILCPFNEQMDDLCANVLRPSVSQLGLTSARADDFSSTTSVVKDIWKGIVGARAVIADCTGRNANVFYEIGLCHALGKPTILLTQDIDEMPFDLRDVRTIVYDYTPPGVRKLESALVRTLTAILPISRRPVTATSAPSATAKALAAEITKRLGDAREGDVLLKTLSHLGLLDDGRTALEAASAKSGAGRGSSSE